MRIAYHGRGERLRGRVLESAAARMPTESHFPPSRRRLEWCTRALGGDVHLHRCIDVRRLEGGLDATTHLLLFQSGDERREVVLRELSASRTTSQLGPATQAAVLAALPALDWPAVPRCLAVDARSDARDCPALLMTRVPGRPNLSVHGVLPRARQLGRALAALHAARPVPPVECPPLEIRRLPTPPTGSGMGTELCDWQGVRAALHGFRWNEHVLIHADFHVGNALFDDEQLTGIVDWASARAGPTGFDVGYCWMDLAVVFGLSVADEFVAAYRQASGSDIAELRSWGLLGAVVAYPDPSQWLASWHSLGRDDLTVSLVRERFAAFVERTLRS